MDNILKKIFVVLLFFSCMVSITSTYAQNVGTDAPTFKMYQYKDLQFSTDTVYGKKIVTFVFGSIT
jgi:hypothetical protein